MKIKTDTIRVKLVWALLASVAMSGVCMLFLCIIMIMASRSRQFAIFFNEHVFGFVILFSIIFSILVIVFFLLLIRKRVLYLEEITKNLETISNGNLEIDIPIKTFDELGKMAKTVNDMAYKLKITMEEERRLEKTKNDLITNISHDLRTPLTSTLGYLELIANMKLEDETSLKRHIDIAYSKCKDLKKLIEDLFEYSKLNNAQMTMNKTKISLGELLEQVMAGFIPALKEAKMEYRLSFINEKLIIYADPLLLTRVFNNLIMNAVKYGREGKYIDIELERDEGEAVIRIISYGKMISEVDLPYIFEKFYQVDKARSGRNGGAGLGLAIAKRIVEMHGGFITASSLDNRTVFEVRLK